MMRWQTGAAIAAAVALLSACGGGGDPAPVRGGVLQVESFGSYTSADIDAATQAAGSRALTGAAACDVSVQRIRYQTVDPKGAFATASTAVMVPSSRTNVNCNGTRPVVLYTHGTSTAKSFNMADTAKNGEAAFAMAMYAAQGFIVVAPNYLGYDTSSLTYHPYLNAEASAVDVVDALRAARGYLAASSSTRPSSQLFITGYSQGGHVAMAAHKVIERDHAGEITVTASGPMAGPYNLVGFGDAIVGVPATTAPRVSAGAMLFFPMLLTSYQRAYGDMYANAADVYQAPYAAGAESLFPTDTSIEDLFKQGKLPPDPTFTRLFGAGGLFTDAFRNGYATSRARAAAATNTLTGRNPSDGTTNGWKPRAPVVMCAGALDPTVYYAENQPVALQVLQSPEFRPAAPAFVVGYNLEDRSTLPAGAAGDQIYAGFQAAKTAAGANALAQYHGTLVPPFCNALVRATFQQILVPPTP